MAKFLTGNDLNAEVEKIFEKADEQIIIISPFIKLNEHFARVLKSKKSNPKIEIIIVFGKNEDDLSKSMTQEDFYFFRDFPNIEIRYEKNLHAKYYANETAAILTSMNLHRYSQENNIEAGVKTKATFGRNQVGTVMSYIVVEDEFDKTAWLYFKRVIDQSIQLFCKTPQYEKAMLGFQQNYKTSIIEIDKLSEFFSDMQSFEKKHAAMQMPKIDLSSTGSHRIVAEKFLSITAISKQLGISSKELFTKFEQHKLIEKKNGDWVLTELGKREGGQMKNGQYGEYIAWPENMIKS